MKICAACCIELPRDRFSKKQWHTKKHQRRCTACINSNQACTLFDEALFKQPPRLEDCPICFLRSPEIGTGSRYMLCCGKIICSGCIHAGATTGHDKLCPFCRSPPPIFEEEIVERNMKRVKMGDPKAMYTLGYYYDEGIYGLSQDYNKALELWQRAGELGFAASYFYIGTAYRHGRGVERNEKNAKYYYELAAMGGVSEARHNLGCSEGRAGNIDRALKHFMIAVEGGDNDSLKKIKQLYTSGRATKDDYATALKAYQAYLVEITSDQRDEAAAFSEEYKYYEL